MMSTCSLVDYTDREKERESEPKAWTKSHGESGTEEINCFGEWGKCYEPDSEWYEAHMIFICYIRMERERERKRTKRVYEMKSVYSSVNINHQSSGILFIISRIYKLFWFGEFDISIDFFVFFSLFCALSVCCSIRLILIPNSNQIFAVFILIPVWFVVGRFDQFVCVNEQIRIKQSTEKFAVSWWLSKNHKDTLIWLYSIYICIHVRNEAFQEQNWRTTVSTAEHRNSMTWM